MYLITGGFGFIGSNLINRLNENGISNICVVDRQNSPMSPHYQRCCINEFIEVNYFIEQVLSRQFNFNDIDVIIHCGAISDSTLGDLYDFEKYNWEFTYKLLKFAHDKNIKVINMSSCQVYGNSQNCKETNWRIRPSNVYADYKLKVDRLIRDHYQNNVSLRLFNIFGPGERHKKSKASMIHRVISALKGEEELTLYHKNNTFPCRDFLYIDSLIDIIEFFMFNTCTGIYNVGSGSSVSYNDLVDMCKQAFVDLGYKYKPEASWIKFKHCKKMNIQMNTKAPIEKLKLLGCKYNSKLYSNILKYIEEWA